MMFELTATYITLDTNECSVCLKPTSTEISDYIATYKSYADEATAISNVSSFISEQTPLLFTAFQSMENVPIEIRNNYTL